MSLRLVYAAPATVRQPTTSSWSRLTTSQGRNRHLRHEHQTQGWITRQPDVTRGADHQHQVQDDVEAVPDEHGEGEGEAVVSQLGNAALESLQTRLCDPELLVSC